MSSGKKGGLIKALDDIGKSRETGKSGSKTRGEVPELNADRGNQNQTFLGKVAQTYPSGIGGATSCWREDQDTALLKTFITQERGDDVGGTSQETEKWLDARLRAGGHTGCSGERTNYHRTNWGKVAIIWRCRISGKNDLTKIWTGSKCFGEKGSGGKVQRGKKCRGFADSVFGKVSVGRKREDGASLY